MNTKVEAGMGLVILWLQQALILAYEDNCPLRPVKTGRYSLKGTSELESFRKGVRRLFNKCCQIGTCKVGNSIEKLRRKKLLKMLGGLSVVPLMTYL
jgi:hypothetical protein